MKIKTLLALVSLLVLTSQFDGAKTITASAPTPVRLANASDQMTAQIEDGIITRFELPESIQSSMPLPPLGNVDPELEFIRGTHERGGTYHGGPGAVNVLAGDMNGDGYDEVCTTALARGPIYCWDSQGRLLSGWGPTMPTLGAGLAALGDLDEIPGLDVFAGYWDGLNAGYVYSGTYLLGWPKNNANYVSTQPSFTRIESATVALLGEEDWLLHAYFFGAPTPKGWPTDGPGGQERHTPATADVDGDGLPEIFTTSGWTTGGVRIIGYEDDGSMMSGYSLLFERGTVDTFPILGDVDGDGQIEMIIVTRGDAFGTAKVWVINSATGTIEGSFVIESNPSYGVAPALADLDQECGNDKPQLEIIVQTDGRLDVLRWNGSAFSNYPGWPQIWSTSEWFGNSGPVVGDLDGDQQPDIAVTSQMAGSSIYGWLRVYNKNGQLERLKALDIGFGGGPAITNEKGRNRLWLKSSQWDGYSGSKPTLWKFDLAVGKLNPKFGQIQWSQFNHDAQHTGYFPGAVCEPQADMGAGLVTQSETGTLGEPVTFTLDVSNTGPLTGTNVVVQFVLPSSAKTNHPNCENGTEVTGCLWAVQNWTPKIGLVTMVVVTPTVTGTMTGTLKVEADELDPNPANNTTTVSVPVLRIVVEAQRIYLPLIMR